MAYQHKVIDQSTQAGAYHKLCSLLHG